MQLNEKRLKDYVNLKYACGSEEKRSQIMGRLKTRLKDGSFKCENVFVYEDDAGKLAGAITLSPMGKNVYVINNPCTLDSFEKLDLMVETLLPQIMQHGRAMGAKALLTRPDSKIMSPAYRTALKSAGFECRGERVEFRTDVDNLPLDEGSPLTWKDMEEAGWELAVEMFRKCTKNSPDGLAPCEDPAEVLQEYLSDPMLNSSPGCVHIGYLDEEPIAFICSQVDPESGWSRITYMGLVEAHRHKGFGQWVHRHGFAMMKNQGGKIYHGGTNIKNTAMVELFKKHGCEGYARMTDWEWHAPHTHSKTGDNL